MSAKTTPSPLRTRGGSTRCETPWQTALVLASCDAGTGFVVSCIPPFFAMGVDHSRSASLICSISNQRHLLHIISTTHLYRVCSRRKHTHTHTHTHTHARTCTCTLFNTCSKQRCTVRALEGPSFFLFESILLFYAIAKHTISITIISRFSITRAVAGGCVFPTVAWVGLCE